MVVGEKLRVIRARILLFPHNVRYEVFLSEYLVSDLTSVVYLGVIHRYEEEAIVLQ